MDAVDLARTLGADISNGAGSFSGGPVDLSEVDFDYVAKLSSRKDARKLTQIIHQLEQDGGFPDLLRACKNKLIQIDPASAPLISAPPSRSEQADAVAELASWSASARAREAALRQAATTAAVANAGAATRPPSQRATPPVRGHADSAFEAAPAKPAAAATAAAKLGQELDASTLLPAEVAAAALLEKEKGNECFRAREYDEAVVFYTRSLHLVSTDPAVLNNRALAFLRLKQLDNALNDVSLVLQQDATNWKALWRRGQVHEARLFLERALDDFKLAQSHWSRTPEAAQTPVHPDIAKNIRKVEKQLSEQEPNHPYVQHLRPAAAATTKSSKQEEEKQNASAPAPQPQQAFKRMAIAEVDEDEEEEEEEEEDQTPQATTASVTGVAAAPVQPADAPAAAAAPPQPTSSMRRMPIAEVDDDDEEDEDAEEVVATKPATPTPAPAPAPAKAKVKKVAEPAFHSKSGGMMIELVDDEEEEEERAAAAAEKEAANARNKAAAASASAASPAAAKPVAAAAATSMLPSASSSFVMPPVPSSSVAFQRDWAELRSAQRPAADQFAYLRSIEPATLVKLLAGGASGSGAVDAKLFAQVLSLCGSHWVSSDLSRAVQLLQLLSTSGRFALNVGMAGSEIRAVLKQALQRAVDRAEGADEIEGVAVEAIKALIKKY